MSARPPKKPKPAKIEPREFGSRSQREEAEIMASISAEPLKLPRATRRPLQKGAATIDPVVLPAVHEPDVVGTLPPPPRWRRVLAWSLGLLVLAGAVSVYFSILRHRSQPPGESVEVRADLSDMEVVAPDPFLMQTPKQAFEGAEKFERGSPDYRKLKEYNKVVAALKPDKEGDAELQRLIKSVQTETNDNPDYWLCLADVLQKAIRTRNSSITKPLLQQIKPIYERAIETGKSQPVVTNAVADSLLAQGGLSEGIDLYRRVLVERGADQDASVKLAFALLATGQKTQATSALRDAVQADPANSRVREVFADMLRDQGSHREALNEYEMLIVTAPEEPSGYVQKAVLLVEALRQPDKALPFLHEAVQQFAGNVPLTYELAVAELATGRNADALRHFEEVIASAPNANAPLHAMVFFNYGVALQNAGQIDKAVENYRKSIAMDPEHSSEARNNLAYLFVERGESLDEARELIGHALALSPSDSRYLDTLGWLQFQRGDYATALKTFQRAVENMRAADPALLIHLGDTYAKLGDQKQALAQWRRALTYDSANQQLLGKIRAADGKAPAP